ncbi:uncharacterized protein LODBEIA_P29120 [Lodderomyces beijingensis]|uniref:glucan 1,3-beta-glucosidase n=1 Tax=Lodderomyces beijingensis TaxID=1775926 RepID=A0ABP0ZM23_9ASCO
MKFEILASIAVLLFSNCLNALSIQRQPVNSQAVERRGGFNAWDYNKDTVRGLNLGGWFVLEPYITPSLFGTWLFPQNTPVDEYHFTQQLGKEAAKNVLNQHWSTWITENDFKEFSKQGINTVRIPIGYWAFQLLDNDPYVQGQVKYLDQALQWAKETNVKVWIDLHGVPGSQNGFDNSGLRDHIDWQKGDNVKVTLNVLQTIFKKYGGTNYADVVSGIELVNEPLGSSLDMGQLHQYLQDGYTDLRSTGSYTPVIIHDAFQPKGYWDNYFTTADTTWNVVIDHHHYQVFSPGEVERNIDQHLKVACDWGWDYKSESHWQVAGEWSAALTDCAPLLNGVNRGARYSGQYDNSPFIGSCDPYLDIAKWPQDYKTKVRKYIEAQLDAFEYTGGWIFWNLKTESAGEWDFQKLVYNKLFPQPLTDRQYPNQCGFPSK